MTNFWSHILKLKSPWEIFGSIFHVAITTWMDNLQLQFQSWWMSHISKKENRRLSNLFILIPFLNIDWD